MDSLHTLTPGVYIGSECLDFNLRMHWMKERNHVFMWYLHLEGVRCLQSIEGPEEIELKYFRQNMCLPTEEVADVRPVVCIVHHVNHYFTVVADFEEDVMYVFGRHITPEFAGVGFQDEDDWEQWHGDFLWVHLPKLFQWEEFSMRPNLIVSVNWCQVGVKLLVVFFLSFSFHCCIAPHADDWVPFLDRMAPTVVL